MADDKPAYQPEWVTKVDVARRQVVAAIRMFFERADPIVAHSVISAGHQILTDLREIAAFLRFADLEEHLMNEHGASLVEVLPKIRASLLGEDQKEPKGDT